ncbi:MAG: hypothetical protein FVQ82_06075 [Planctomycetes bacterium]|nr:hypothetical protein [Planctomycetota bacterium]
MKKLFALGCIMLMTVGLLVTGCEKKSKEDHTDHEHEEKTSEVLPEGANLMCPVMPDEKALVSLFVEFEDNKIYVCCKKCLGKVKVDPASWYAKAYSDKHQH